MTAPAEDPRSLWLDRADSHPAPSAVGSDDLAELAARRVDVVVIGAGLAGICTALRLHEEGLVVAVVEAGRIARRTTGHSTAKITSLQGVTYSSLARGKGHEAAEIYASTSAAAVIGLRDIAARLAIDCDLLDASAYTCAATDAGVRTVEAEAEAARAAGLPVELTTSTDLPFAVSAAVRLDDQAHFDPVAFCAAVVAHLRAAGVPVIEGARVTDVEESDAGCSVRIDTTSIACDWAVITTHLPIADPALLAGRTHPERSYAVSGLVAADSPSAAIRGMYLAADTGWSIRPAPADGASSRLIVGGEGHSMQDHVGSSEHYRRLEWWAHDRLGVTVGHRWSAFDYAPADGVPFIGRLAPRSRRRLVATGFRKWGMTTSLVAADLLASIVADRPHPAQALFDSTRIIPTLGKDVVKSNARVAARFIGDRLQVRSDRNPGGLQPGEGRVVRDGAHPVAVARDRNGTLHAVKATCTHLGCLVGFNDGEQTWDCPCHGSRFALDGSVLDGPASQPLERVEPVPGT